MTRVLFVAVNSTSLNGFAGLSKESSSFDCKPFIFYPQELDIPISCEAITPENYMECSWFDDSNLFRPLKRLMNRISSVFRRLSWELDFQKKTKAAFAILGKFRIERMYCYGDRSFGWELAFQKAARELSIKILIPQIAFFSECQNLLATTRKLSPSSLRQLDVSRNTVFKKKYPKQWRHDTVSGRDFSYYPIWLVSHLDREKLLNPNPWSMGCGLCDLILTESKIARKRLVENGTPESKIKIVGCRSFDHLHKSFENKQEIKKIVIEKYNLCDKQKVIIISLPQLYEHNLATNEEHWVIQKTICDHAQKTDSNVLLSLHPKMQRKEYLILQDDYGCKILKEDLHTVLPVADLYLVGQGSSTIPWAVLSEVPLIILDSYGLEYDYYDWIKCAKIIKNISALNSCMEEMLQNLSLRSKTKKELQELKEHYIFDGHSLDRIFKVC